MSRLLLLLLCLFSVFDCDGQNLLVNGNFESYTNCPATQGQLNRTSPWYNPTSSSPDYFNECSSGSVDVPQNMWGSQTGRSGSGYTGVATYHFSANAREYITQQLNSPLVSGINYYLEFFVSLADTSSDATDGLGIYISQNAITGGGTNLPYIPQIRQPDGVAITDKVGWTKISGFYSASGGEKFITIGNFYPDSLTTIVPSDPTGQWTAYYYIDDVLLIPDSLVSVNKKDRPHPVILQEGKHLSIRLQKSTVGHLKIYQLDGKLIREEEINGSGTVNLESYSTGIYFLVVESAGEMFTRRVFID